MTDPILGFGHHPVLSNFHPVPVALDGVLCASVEVAYQAAKTIEPEWRSRLLAIDNPGKAKRHASRVPHRVDWPQVRMGVMRNLLRQKFSWPHARRALLDTGDRELIELNQWNDTFWGMIQQGDERLGENHLGRLLMELRQELRDALPGTLTIVAFDLEATCWMPEQRPSSGVVQNEIIEIGAVAWTPGATAAALPEYQAFIRPTEQPALSAFCTELTSIAQSDVAGARTLIDVLPAFLAWCDSLGPHLLVSWGAWDKDQIRGECIRKGIPAPLFESRHVNAKARFAAVRGLPKQCGMGKAAEMLNIAAAEPAHRAIADARTLAAILDEGLGATLLEDLR